jgi:hypothetical protein
MIHSPGRRGLRVVAGKGLRRSLLPVVLPVLLLLPAAGRAQAAEPARYQGKPAVPFLMSAILPGAGQIYLKQNRGYLYLGLDAAVWFARFAYQDASFRKIGESEEFARRHWSLDRYQEAKITCDTFYRERLYEQMKSLAEQDPRGFYDNLAREDTLRPGWDDSWDRSNPDTLKCGLPSANWNRFRDLRTKSDDLRNNARLAVVMAVLNRVVSSIDALRAARRHRLGGDAQGFHLETNLRGSLRHPRAELKLVRYLP